MRVLLVSAYFPPQQAVASMRPYTWARTWASSGVDVDVLTTEKREDQRGLDVPAGDYRLHEIAFSVPRMLERFRARRRDPSEPSSVAPRPGRLQRLRTGRGIYASVRMPDLTDYWMRPALAWCRRNGPWDVVVSTSGPYTTHLVAQRLRANGLARRWVADYRDLWTGNHLFRGLFPFTLREKHLEAKCLGEVDLVIAATDGLADSLRRRTSAPVEVVTNGHDASLRASLRPASALPTGGATHLVYTGTTYPHGQDPEPLIAALGRLGKAAPHLHVVGRGAERWTDLAMRHGAFDRVHVRGPVPLEEALRMQRDANGLVLLDWVVDDAGVLTGKVFEYLAAEAPILVVGPSQTSPALALVEEAGRGVHLGNDPTGIAEALNALFIDRTTELPTARADVVARYDRERLAIACLERVRSVHEAAEASR